jgi:hypothetical protein
MRLEIRHPVPEANVTFKQLTVLMVSICMSGVLVQGYKIIRRKHSAFNLSQTVGTCTLCWYILTYI